MLEVAFAQQTEEHSFLSGSPSLKAVISAENTKSPGYTSVGKMYVNMDQMKAPVLGQQNDHYP
jgi:hypothetical protein